MVFKGLIAAASAVALMTAPTVAAAQTAAPTVAAQSASTALAPAAENVEGSELRGGFVIPLIAIILIALGLCIATDVCGEKDDLRTSP